MREEGEAGTRKNRQTLHKLLKKTGTETFLCEATTPAGNNWDQTVEVNERHPMDGKELWDEAVREQAREHMSMMCFSLENTTYIHLYQLQILKRRFF